jgi:uncharacterized protein
MASKIIAWPFRALIAIYRYCISPFIAGACRFHPSCSAYADESFQTHNAFKASILTLKRISRCHPWGGSGYDPVPAAIAVDNDDRKGSPERS